MLEEREREKYEPIVEKIKIAKQGLAKIDQKRHEHDSTALRSLSTITIPPRILSTAVMAVVDIP
jgi:hypothetical protein